MYFIIRGYSIEGYSCLSDNPSRVIKHQCLFHVITSYYFVAIMHWLIHMEFGSFQLIADMFDIYVFISNTTFVFVIYFGI